MAVTINVDECTRCDDCIPVCPTQSISVKKGNLVVNAESCTECEDKDSPSCMDVCPSGSITYA
ncbi:MAG: 4Fe-4S binding protein [Zoogloeaceae bacterium]|jgi:ferredoxin|nr:4Fe-4S binding protein [Zoogloeaceae bacterium]